MQDEMDPTHSDDSSVEPVVKPAKPLRQQDRFLPIANITKIMKKAVPPKGKIAKEARECIQECVSEFISFITSEASDRCHMEKRKTINGEDILCAMYALGFDNYIQPLKIYLSKYKDHMLNERLDHAESPDGAAGPSTDQPSTSGTMPAIPANINPDILYQIEEGTLFYKSEEFENY